MSEPFEPPAPRDEAVHDDDGLNYGVDVDGLDDGLNDDGLAGVYRLDTAEPIGDAGYELGDEFGDLSSALSGELDFGDEVTFHAGPAFTAAPTGFEDIPAMPAPRPLSHPAEPVLAEPVLAEPVLAEPVAAEVTPTISTLDDVPSPPAPPPGISGVPSARTGEPIQPASGRPQFTAMIDQLREGFRLGKHRLDGPRHTPDHPAVAETAGLPGNSALFVSPGDESSSRIEGAAWSSVIHPEGQSATVTLEADRTMTTTMTTLTKPDTGSNYESASTAGQAAEGLDALAHNDNHADDTSAPVAPQEITVEMSAAALANARATTIVPGGKSRSRKRPKAVPAQRPAAEDQPIEPLTENKAVAAQSDSASDEISWAESGVNSGSTGHDGFGAPSDHGEPSGDLFGEPDPVEPARGVSAAWRKLRSLTPKLQRSRGDEDQELWTPEIEPAESDDSETSTQDHRELSPSATLAQIPEVRILDAEIPEAEIPEWNASPAPNYERSAFRTASDERASLYSGHAEHPRPAETGFGAVALRPAPADVVTTETDNQLAIDREALRSLGIPASWTRHLRSGDRFAAIASMLERLPELEIAEGVSVIAVIGPADVVELEAHRTALDLPTGGRPRAVAAVPEAEPERSAAIAASKETRPVVVAVAVENYQDPAGTRSVLSLIKAEAVIAVIDASRSLDEVTSWIESLERVDAIALDGALDDARPAELLGLDVPVIRVDGISVDRIGWAALLCAQLAAFDALRARASA